MTKRELSRVLEWIKRARERCTYKPFFGYIYMHETSRGFFIACQARGLIQPITDFKPQHYGYLVMIDRIERFKMLEQFLSENRKYIQSVDLHVRNKAGAYPWQFIYNSTAKVYQL